MELARKELCDHDNFEPKMAFCSISGCPDGEIDEGQISHFCNTHAIRCTLDDAALLISQYDESGNGKLSFREFSSMVLSATNATLRSMAIQRDSSGQVPHSEFLANALDHALSLIFLRELDYQRNVEDIKGDLVRKPDFDIRKLFRMLDSGNPKDRIDRYEIRDFVHEHLRWLDEDDLDAIIRR